MKKILNVDELIRKRDFFYQANQWFHPVALLGQEKYSYVYISYPFWSTKFAPIFFKELFYLTQKNGYLVITYDVKNRKSIFDIFEKSMWWLWKGKYEVLYHGPVVNQNDKVSFILRELSALRPSLSQNTQIFVVKKTIPTIIPGDTMNKWSFGIITNGKRDQWMDRIIRSIKKQNIPNYEIIICGSYHTRKEKECKYFEFKERDEKGWITKKKNIIIQNARYENICIVHDRAIFPSNWYHLMKQYGNCFEAICNKQLYKDVRAYDWVTLGGPLGTQYKIDLLDYRDWDWWSYIGGLQLITKRSIVKNILFDETRYWNGAEDADISFRLRDAGYIARITPAYIYSLGFRHGLIPSRSYDHRLHIPDMIPRRVMRGIARVTQHIPLIHKTLELFCSTNLYKKVTHSE